MATIMTSGGEGRDGDARGRGGDSCLCTDVGTIPRLGTVTGLDTDSTLIMTRHLIKTNRDTSGALNRRRLRKMKQALGSPTNKYK